MVSSPSSSPAHSSAEPVSSDLSASPLIIVSISPEDTQGEGLLDKDQLHSYTLWSLHQIEEETTVSEKAVHQMTSQLRDKYKGSTIQNMLNSTLPEHKVTVTTNCL